MLRLHQAFSRNNLNLDLSYPLTPGFLVEITPCNDLGWQAKRDNWSDWYSFQHQALAQTWKSSSEPPFQSDLTVTEPNGQFHPWQQSQRMKGLLEKMKLEKLRTRKTWYNFTSSWKAITGNTKTSCPKLIMDFWFCIILFQGPPFWFCWHFDIKSSFQRKDQH